MAKTYTTVPAKTAGDTVTETNWDTHIAENINNLITPPMVNVYNSTTSTSSSGIWMTTYHDTERYDTDGMHSTSTNTDRITIQTAGVYLIQGGGYFWADGTGIRAARILLNGTSPIGVTHILNTDAGNVAMIQVYAIADLDATDYVTFQVYQNCGTTLTWYGDQTMSFFSAKWMGRTS